MCISKSIFLSSPCKNHKEQAFEIWIQDNLIQLFPEYPEIHWGMKEKVIQEKVYVSTKLYLCLDSHLKDVCSEQDKEPI